MSAIENFPQPHNITDARSWFGLVNQVAWAYSISDIMLPFRELVKKNSVFAWSDELQKLFDESKAMLKSKVTEGIQTFEPNRGTCLQTDWSKSGIGYLLLQQHCNCNIETAPTCCHDGWKLVFAGSRFTTDAESRYSPTEGEALAVTWSLKHARMFVLGCNQLMVVTDDKPLLGIFKDRELDKLTSQRLCKLKEKTFLYTFTIQSRKVAQGSRCSVKEHSGWSSRLFN